ncbi:cobyrinate a,c-diamide synthase [Serpentinicella alkaliphila]|uniref:Cobyrinate a,c-diamide synthase n=1 Tax=Serpentinicella alkaliphila TaxID=1734049 RepID=A0A4R2U291_9FIRM|nr:cobyrinate a,c-diamide synthase [Serpentinicella alkaliphila]TCQ04179.1 cobyrinic acid a,c-diamide synthase [Serpentinicella alkaliphila]
MQQNKLPRIVIAAPYSGAGKTTISIGIMAALTKRGVNVQPFKIGPDYIDPAFHTDVTKRNSINLDSWLFDEETVIELFQKYALNSDISIIEGVMGLYDGIGSDPMLGSTAGMAHILKAPVILVLPAQGMSTTIAAVIKGLKEFREINIVGVILNKVSTEKYYDLLKETIETNTDVKVLGRLPIADDIKIKSRHLGLVQNCELLNKELMIDKLIALIEEYVDLDQIISLGQNAEVFKIELTEEKELKKEYVNVAVAYDEAFQFYYYDNIKALEELGATITYFSPLKDPKLPENIDGIYIGGGYPELYAKELEQNISMCKAIKDKSEIGMPIYAECGGYMYLNKKIKTLENDEYNMVGVFDGDVIMTKQLQNFGYAELTAEKCSCIFKVGDKIKCHEFHTSYIGHNNEKLVLTEKYRNKEKVSWYSGSKKNNTFGMYPHIHFLSNINIAKNFIESCLNYKELGD